MQINLADGPVLGRLKGPASFGLSRLARAGLVTDHRFVIYCPPRTGSALLMGLLDSHPDVRCEGELLASRVAKPLNHFDGRSALARINGRQAWGCKIISQHLRWYPDAYGGGTQLLDGLVERGYSLLVLRRRDWLLQALSAAHAVRTRYHFTANDRPGFKPMRVDPVEVLSLLLAMEQEDQAVAAAVRSLPHTPIWYEDDLLTVEAQQSTADRLVADLGLDPAPVTSSFVRVAPLTFTDRVANSEEVAELVGSTRFARFLDREQYEV